ncbi:MAG: DUF2617 family protein [Planctomycetota bacterium]|nr:DUF2617 family protein [Planctomycetaceae bacterium]MDQ3331040.1 DUF2617 family protein [Planctomycetota bacterium]
MPVSVVRPAASELVYHLFGRSVHPELFDVRATKAIKTEGYQATISLCDSGHLVSFRCGDQTVTEVLVDSGHLLPEQKRLYGRKVRGSRNDSRVFSDGLRYQTCSQLEVLEPEVFNRTHEELVFDCLKADLAFRFPPGNRLAPAPLSLIRADAQSDGLLLHVFHTFPECRSVIRTQSLFEL